MAAKRRIPTRVETSTKNRGKRKANQMNRIELIKQATKRGKKLTAAQQSIAEKLRKEEGLAKSSDLSGIKVSEEEMEEEICIKNLRTNREDPDVDWDNFHAGDKVSPEMARIFQ